MPFTLIQGTFHVLNYSPDGDSIRFAPDDVTLVRNLAGSRARINARGHVQLRIEAIDALETHYSPPSGGGALHQPLALAQAATDRLLDFVGIGGVQWDQAHRTVIAAADGVRGHVLARTVEKNGRPVAFVFAGDPAEADGREVPLDVARLQGSYNFAALAEGIAYATFYKGLFADLRDALAAAAVAARAAGRGVYATDRTNAGVTATDLGVITDQASLLPKLFRRLSEYMVNFGTAVGFQARMAEAAEPVLDLTTATFTRFDTFIALAAGSVDRGLTRRPEELVFDEMPAQPPHPFSALMPE